MAVDGHIADLAGDTCMAPPEAVLEDDRPSDAGPDGDEQHAARRLILPGFQLGHSRSVHVVVQHASHSELLGELVGQRHVSPAVQHDASRRDTSGKIDLAREAEPGRIERSGVLAELPRHLQNQSARLLGSGGPSGGPDGASEDGSVPVDYAR
jgi:hypothetical protein